MKKTAPSEALWVAPFQDGPLAILKNVLDDADHFDRGESGFEHFANCFSAQNWLFRHLVIRCVLPVKVREKSRVGTVECLNPPFNDFSGFHLSLPNGSVSGTPEQCQQTRTTRISASAARRG